jgi:N-acetylmuramoyl-L-alanine amidase
MLKKSHEFTSPNFTSRPEGMMIDSIIMHFTEMHDDISALKRLCDPKTEVSSHYLINKQGKIFSLVPDHLRAWHAGQSCWRGKEKANDYSIGIELDNNGKEEFSEPLMLSLIDLCHELIKSYPIDQFNIIGHSDVIPSRKFDPGRFFDWKRLAKNKIGIFPDSAQKSVISDIKHVQTMLSDYGYKINITGELDQLTIDVMRAFNEHFNPTCQENWNEHSQYMLEELHRLTMR